VVEEEKILEYSNKGKAMSMPLTITTPDQIFNFVYKYNGFELKLATLSYSKLVIDEIQAYSPDLLAYIILGLENIVKAGGKFAILTATFPPFIMNYLEEVLPKEKLPIYKKFIKDENKPSIRHFLEVKEKELDSQLIKEHFEKFGGKTLVICNTVKKSQQIYKELESFGLKDKIKLFHAKFTREDRKIKENEILKIGETEVKDNVIWITTSIVEASLDIDFDYLFTELNDINGLFQRLGRVNRKGLKQEMLNKPNAYLFTEIDKNILTNESGTRGFIDKTIYNISKKALLEVNGKLTEEKKVELIEKYLIYKDIKNSTFDKRYRDIKKYIESLYIGEKNYKDVQQKFRNIVSFDVIPLEIYEEEKNKKIILENEKILNIKYEKDINLSEEENNKRREKLKLLKIKAKEEIYKFVVSVGQYDINKTGIQVDIGYDKLEVVNCNYSFELGFERVKKENVESKDNDAFL
jgi:CRISPR-associated endonuclease/helicase Cas3